MRNQKRRYWQSRSQGLSSLRGVKMRDEGRGWDTAIQTLRLLTSPVVWTTFFPTLTKSKSHIFFFNSVSSYGIADLWEEKTKLTDMTRFGEIRVNCKFSVSKYLHWNIDRWVTAISNRNVHRNALPVVWAEGTLYSLKPTRAMQEEAWSKVLRRPW